MKGEELRVAGIGSRSYWNEELIIRTIKKIHKKYGFSFMLVSGGAIGADTMVEEAAKRLNIKFLRIPPSAPKDSDRGYYIRALFDRNKEIISVCDIVLAFHTWAANSGGTIHAIECALKDPYVSSIIIYDDVGEQAIGKPDAQQYVIDWREAFPKS